MMKRKRPPPFAFLLACLAITTFPGCLVPPMATMQTARLVERGTARFAPYYLHVEQHQDQDVELGADVYGALVGARLDEAMELQLLYEGTQVRGDLEGHQDFVALGPKFGLTENAAILIPVGLYVGAGVNSFETTQIMPGVLLSRPFGRYIEPIIAGRLVLPFDSSFDKYGVLSAGIGLSPWPTRLLLTPEVGMAWNISGDSVDELLSVGVGVSWFPR